MAETTARLLTPAEAGAALELWESSARRLPQHPLFYESASEIQPAHTIGVFNKQGLVAVVPLLLRQGRYSKALLSPPFAPWAGALISRENDAKRGAAAERFWRDVWQAVAQATPFGFAKVEIIVPVEQSDVRPLRPFGWRVEAHYNYLTRWDKHGEWRERLDSATKRQEKKALKSDLSFVAGPARDVEDLQAIYRKMAERQGLDPRMADVIARLGRGLDENEFGFTAFVKDADGRTHAGALIGHDETRVYYLVGASDSELLGSGAPTFLHTSILEEIERRALPRCYDWVGANTPSIAKFKRGFGPELELLPKAVLSSKWYDALKLLQRFRASKPEA